MPRGPQFAFYFRVAYDMLDCNPAPRYHWSMVIELKRNRAGQVQTRHYTVNNDCLTSDNLRDLTRGVFKQDGFAYLRFIASVWIPTKAAHSGDF